jgi:hypothetical protein
LTLSLFDLQDRHFSRQLQDLK